LPEPLREQLRLIVVDDGSPEGHEAKYSTKVGIAFDLYRIKVDIRWNQDAARNLAVHHAKTVWLLLTDIDHIPPEGTLRYLVERSFDDQRVFKFQRQTLEKGGKTTPYKPHPNSWFMTKKTFDRLGGYDESLAGFYGTDADFRSRIEAVVGQPLMLDVPLIRVPRDIIPDASTTTYTRKDPLIDIKLGDMIRKRNATPGWRTKRLSFPWERVDG
jgi:hypothetical protein